MNEVSFSVASGFGYHPLVMSAERIAVVMLKKNLRRKCQGQLVIVSAATLLAS